MRALIRGYPHFGPKRPKRKVKQISKVLKALEDGAETSVEIASLTGLSVRSCSAWLHELGRMGLARKVRRNYVRFSTHAGRRCDQWKPAQPEAA